MNIFFERKEHAVYLRMINIKFKITVSSQEELGFESNAQILLSVIFYFISCQIFTWCLLYYYHYFYVHFKYLLIKASQYVMKKLHQKGGQGVHMHKDESNCFAHSESSLALTARSPQSITCKQAHRTPISDKIILTP